MRLKKIIIQNFRSIINDEINFEDFTFFVGKNNYGKSNYLKAIDFLLSFSKTYAKEISEIQYNKKLPILIEGWFDNIKTFTPNLKDSKHQVAVEKLIDSTGLIRLRLTISLNGEAETLLVNPSDGKTQNVTGWQNNCKKLFPETIFVLATADTADELQEKSSAALSKIKKEIMQQFFTSLSAEVKKAFEPVDKFLNGEYRSKELEDIEKDFADEMMGEFSGVKPKIKFSLPDSTVIGHGMKINLNDGFHECEIEQKGQGLQRTALFAMMRLLSKHHTVDQSKPAPIFLIEELEAFLHPSAQKKLAESMADMSKKYQTIASTHSPFVLTPNILNGYRKITRSIKDGSKCVCLQKNNQDLRKKEYDNFKNSLAHTGNLVSLFSDIVVIVEGTKDIGFYNTVLSLTIIKDKEKVSFVGTTSGGNSGFHVSYNFFKLIGFNKVFAICDIDTLFNINFKEFLKVKSINSDFIDEFRGLIGFNKSGQPSLEEVLLNINKVGIKKIENKIKELKKNEIFVLTKGAPENYYSDNLKNNNPNTNIKSLWEKVESKNDFDGLTELTNIMKDILI